MTHDIGPRSTNRDKRPQRNNPQHLDNYPHAKKPGHTLVCPDCQLVLHEGRWRWGAPPIDKIESARCPACTRIREHDARGTLRLDPAFTPFREEVLGMLKNVEEVEKEEHPLERLMDVKDTPDGMLVTTTGVHLARRVAHKLGQRFHKKPRLRYEDGEQRVIVDWPAE